MQDFETVWVASPWDLIDADWAKAYLNLTFFQSGSLMIPSSTLQPEVTYNFTVSLHLKGL